MAPTTVADVMTTEVRSISSLDVIDTARAVLHESGIGAVPVLSADGQLAGMLTSRDLVEDWDPGDSVESVMTTDVVTASKDLTITGAATLMLTHQIHHLVVMHDGDIVGLVSSFDLLRALADEMERIGSKTLPERHAPAVGDQVVIRGHATSAHERRGRIVEIRGEDGGPPYMVQWLDDPHDEPHSVMFFPGPDADIEPPT